jgi:periplasmic protein TonB
MLRYNITIDTHPAWQAITPSITARWPSPSSGRKPGLQTAVATACSAVLHIGTLVVLLGATQPTAAGSGHELQRMAVVFEPGPNAPRAADEGVKDAPSPSVGELPIEADAVPHAADTPPDAGNNVNAGLPANPSSSAASPPVQDNPSEASKPPTTPELSPRSDDLSERPSPISPVGPNRPADREHPQLKPPKPAEGAAAATKRTVSAPKARSEFEPKAVAHPEAPFAGQAASLQRQSTQGLSDAAGSDDKSWIRVVGNWLAAHKTYPEEARRNGEQGRVAVRFVVDRSGKVLAVNIVRSSGSVSLDRAAASLLQSAELPPIPASDQRLQITITVQITYELAN